MDVGVEDRNVASGTQGSASTTAEPDYNFAHFRFRHVLADAAGTIRSTGRGIH